MIEFHNIEINDLDKIQRLIHDNNIKSSLYSAYNLYALRQKYNTKLCYYKDTLFIEQSSRNINNYNAYLFPIGNESIELSIRQLYETAKKNNNSFMIWGLSIDMMQRLKEIFPSSFVYEKIPNWSDYIYEHENFINCKTIKKANKFTSRFNGRYQIEEISQNNINSIIKFQYKWMQDNINNNLDIKSLIYEHNSIIETLRTWGNLPLIGFCIKVDGKIVGFTYGFLQTSDCFVIHVIKSIKSINGLTLFLLKYLAVYVNTKYINFEEDIGIEGLRIFKSRLHPLFMLDKYIAINISAID